MGDGRRRGPLCGQRAQDGGAGFEQGSVFHLQGDLVDNDRLSECADLLMTTSPSVLVYAAMDGWRRQMVERGHELLSRAIDLAHQVRTAVKAIPDIEVLDDELLGVQASHDLDPLAGAHRRVRHRRVGISSR